MKVFLLNPAQDVDLEQPLRVFASDLHADLGLEVLFQTMAAGDDFFADVVKKVVLSAQENDLETIIFRQEILKDCLKNQSTIKKIYALCLETIKQEKKHYYGIFSQSPEAIVQRSVEVLAMFAQKLRQLRALTRAQANEFASSGFTRLFAELEHELDDAYFAEIDAHLKTLRSRDTVLVSATMGFGGKGENYTLRAPLKRQWKWLPQILLPQPPHYSFTLHPRDEAGARALGELRDRGLNTAANALAQSNEHILNFFKTLQKELAFYLGSINLYEALRALKAPLVFPTPKSPEQATWRCQNLYDPSLALSMQQPVVGNSLDANGRQLVLITGANRGGKSTFLRSAGLAQLMMQTGMFVAAQAFSASLCSGLFTHFKREEDREMVSGKFDEELARMSRIADNLGPGALVLFNESFAATNEHEGAEIARQIVEALLENHVRMFFVTHMFTFAHGMYDAGAKLALCLRAERREDGTRSFRLQVAPPLETSFGADLYREIWR